MASRVDIADVPATPERLVSLDALRGFDMFWITFGEVLLEGIRSLGDNEWVRRVSHQLEHVAWEGFVFYDLIFPLFVFIMGASIPFSFSRRLERGETKSSIYRHLLLRAVILFCLGIFYNGGLSKPWPDVRIFGVLQRIAMCYLFGGLIYLNFRPRGQAIWLVVLLVGYWALLTFVPVPGRGAEGIYTPEGNLAGYIDRTLPLGRYHEGLSWDPEGYLSAIPPVGTCLMGLLAGQLLMTGRMAPPMKVFVLLGAGIVSTVLGYAWGTEFPVIKKIWTSSFVLVAGGYSCLLLALFYQVVDVWKLRRWAIPLVVIGVNPLLIYLLMGLNVFDTIADRLVGGSIAEAAGPYAQLLRALIIIALGWGMLYWLWRRRIFIKI